MLAFHSPHACKQGEVGGLLFFVQASSLDATKMRLQPHITDTLFLINKPENGRRTALYWTYLRDSKVTSWKYRVLCLKILTVTSGDLSIWTLHATETSVLRTPCPTKTVDFATETPVLRTPCPTQHYRLCSINLTPVIILFCGHNVSIIERFIVPVTSLLKQLQNQFHQKVTRILLSCNIT